MYVPSVLFLFVWFCFYHLSGFCFFVFFGIFLIFFIEMTNGWWGLGPWPEVGPEPLVWEHRVQNSRLSEDSWPQSVMISENSHEGLHPNLRPSTTHLPGAPSTGRLTQTANKIATQTQPSAGRQTVQIPQNTACYRALPIRQKNSLSPTRMQKKVPLNMNLHKALKHTHPLGAEARNKNYNPTPWEKDTSHIVS